MQNRQIEHSIEQFAELTHAAIDASSMIYLQKLGLLRELSTTILLSTTADVWAETNFTPSDLRVRIFTAPVALSPDEQILHLARSNNWALVSEDRKLLLKAKKARIPYFNALMMILFLFFKGKLPEKSVREKTDLLKKIARYGAEIWDYGNSLFLTLQKERTGK